jgi:hypothetical protein
VSSQVRAASGSNSGSNRSLSQAHDSVDVRPRQRDHPPVQFVAGARVRVCAGPFAGHEVEVIEPPGNNLIRVVVMLLDGPARLELSVLDLDPDAGGARGAGVRVPRRRLLPHGSASVALPLPPESG